MTLKNKQILIGIVIAILATLTYQLVKNGYHTEYVTEIDISQSSRAWLTAEFSEVTVCLDPDGSISMCTDYWDSAGSDVWSFKTVNGEIYGELNMPDSALILDGKKHMRIQGYPEGYRGMQARPHFDNFTNRKNVSYQIYFAYKKEPIDSYTVDKNTYKNLAKLNLDRRVNLIVDMWYGSVREIKINTTF